MDFNYQITPFNIELEEAEFTPVSLISAVNEKLTARRAPSVCITGICMEIGDHPYYGYYFGKLLDPEHTEFDIKLKIAQSLRTKIVPNTLYRLTGFLEKQISNRKDGNIGIVFRVSDVIHSESDNVLKKRQQEQAAIIASKRHKDSNHVKNVIISAIHKYGRARLLVITGERAVTFHDVMESLGAAKSYFSITEKRVNFTHAEHICEVLNKADQSARYDVISLVRGGGDGLGVFSDTGLLKTAAQIKKSCLVTALGHFEDQSAVDRVADYVCGTPTDFGYFLSGTAYEMRREYYRKKDRESKRRAWTIAFLATIGFVVMLIQYWER